MHAVQGVLFKLILKIRYCLYCLENQHETVHEKWGNSNLIRRCHFMNLRQGDTDQFSANIREKFDKQYNDITLIDLYIIRQNLLRTK